MNRSLLRLLIAILMTLVTTSSFAQSIRRIDPRAKLGSSAAAIIVDDAPLLHTAQLLPVGDDGKLAADDFAGQFEHLWSRLEKVLKAHDANEDGLVKLNFYVARPELGDAVRQALASKFQLGMGPTVSFVVTRLPVERALVGVDAVAVLFSKAPDGKTSATAAVLPAGSRIHISGQAEPGTLREATRKTLESLTATLKHCGRDNGDAVSLKCFLQPMTSVAEVEDEIARYFSKEHRPVVSYVEWKSSAPIEIEMVAWGGPARSDAPRVEFITPPFMKASPVYCRVARINYGETIFLSDLVGKPDASPAEELADSFEQLRDLLGKTGSDLKHLVKATYYVTGDEINKQHNEIRPKYYDPARPPAASKAMVEGTGWGTRYTMDMIAVPSGSP